MTNDRPPWLGTSLSGDVLRRMAINVEPASKHASAASAFPNRLRIAAGQVSGGYASRPASEVPRQSGRFEDVAVGGEGGRKLTSWPD
jgi:hypothetical protein